MSDAISTMTPDIRRERVNRRRLELLLVAAVAGLGAIQGYRMVLDEPVTPVAYEAGSLVATGELERALYDPATGRHEGGFAIARLSGPTADGRCRRFSDGQVSGVACLRDGDWRVSELRQGNSTDRR